MTRPTAGTDRRRSAALVAALAALCYVPLLATARGMVAADTKAYLYLDPGRLLSRAASLWDPHVGMGTVTHQNIGYLWPMGPWFWVFDRLGSPDWVAQRLWTGTLLFTAALGILYLGRTIGPKSHLAWGSAAVAYALSPYVLDYVSRISVLLLPWAALPWMIALTQRSLQTRSWRYPAVFALVVATAGGINATALVLAGLGPVLWVFFSWRIHGEVSGRTALVTVARMGVLTVLTNLWWIAGLAVQSGWGLDVLRYTETVETVARTSLSSEVLRGLGYWFFYGTDKLGAWIEPGRTFTEQPWLIVVGFVLPVAAMVAVVLVRWRYRAFSVALVLLGTAIAVGAYPYDHPSPLGAVFKRFAMSSTAGLALRSTARAVPLVVLGIAMLVAALVAALARRRPRAAGGVALAVVLVAVAGNPALLTGEFVGRNLDRPEHVPGYWRDAARWLDGRGDATRVLEIPGSDFAAYRWGNSVDPVTPGLIDRPWVARELIPFGTEASADLLIALDHRIQEGILDPSALAPVARLMGVGDIVVRGDLEYERYRTARPSQVWSLVEASPGGLGRPVPFGAPTENRAAPELPMHDEIYFGDRAGAVRPPVAAVPVTRPLPIVRLRGASNPTVLEGDGEGVVDAAGAGLLGGDQVLLSGPALAARPSVLARAVAAGGTLIVSDTNRQRARRWGTVRDNEGYTETPGEEPAKLDPSDNRVPVFPSAGPGSQTTMELRGVERIAATAYGNSISYTPADRPANAFDGDPATAWSVGTFGPVGGERLLLRTERPVTTDHVDVVQADKGSRRITKLGVVLDGRRVATAHIDDRSLSPAGQRLELGRQRTFRTLELVIEGDNVGRRGNYAEQNGVGLAEVGVAGVRVDQVVQLPTSLLAAAGTSVRNPLDILLSRLRASPAEPFAADEEPTLVRAFRLPVARTFAIEGTARVDAGQPDERLDTLLGGVAGRTVRSSGRLPGDLGARGSSAVDGDPATAWVNRLGEQEGAWIEVEGSRPATVDGLDLAVVADGDHSVPTRVTVRVDDGEERTVELPPVEDGTEAGHVARARVAFPPLTGTVFRVTIDAVRPVVANDWFTKRPTTMPVAVAEIGAPALTGARAVDAPSGCRADLVTLDGRPVSVRVTGSPSDASALNGLRLQACGPDARGVALAPGRHELRSAPGPATGLDVDGLTLRSAAGGGPAAPVVTGSAPTAAGAAGVKVVRSSETSFDLRVTGDGSGKPVWLVLGESWSRGWKATVGGRSLGEPVLADGYANGWLVDPGRGGVAVELRWTPQRLVRAGIAASAAGVVLCLVILLAGWLRTRRRGFERAAPDPVLRAVPLRAGPAVPWPRAVLSAVGAGIVVGLVVHPLMGLAAVPVTLLALRNDRGRAVGAAGALAVASAGMFTAAKQWRNDFVADFGWTGFFEPAHFLAWGGLALVAILLLVDRRRRT